MRRAGQGRLLVAAFLLWVLFAQAIASAPRLSITTDEGLHITSGYTVLRTGDLRLVEEHPPLVKVLMAWPLLLVPDLPDPRTLPGWESDVPVTDSVRLVRATQSLVYPYQPIDRLVFAARVPVALLAVLLGAVVFRWAKDLWGESGGLLALFLLAFDPNIIAHASLAGTDLGAACFITLALFSLARFLRRPTAPRLVWVGMSLGLAQAAKLSAVLLIPIAGVLGVMELRQRRLASVALILLIAGLTLWAVYGFEVRPLPGVPLPIPAASHSIPWLRLLQHMSDGHAAFLMGQNSTQGWWYYFLVAFGLKTPLPTLMLLLIATAVSTKRSCSSLIDYLKSSHFGGSTTAVAVVQLQRQQLFKPLREGGSLLLFPLVYWGSSLLSTLNIGYRHLLPILPCMFVFIAQLVGAKSSSARRAFVPSLSRRLPAWSRPLFGLTLAAWYITGTLNVFPHALAFFNELAGGPDGGWRYLADSNTDWGQALKELAAYQQIRSIARVRLSMFTFLDPAVYGVRYEPLTPMRGNTPAVFPSRFNPPPADYVISATTLQGIPLADPEMFDWFRKRQPDARIGHVMFLYRVQTAPPRAWVAECTAPVVPLEPGPLVEGLGRADLRLAYFDCGTSWLYPTGGKVGGWIVLARDAPAWAGQYLEGARQSYDQKRTGFSPPFRIYEDDRSGADIAPNGQSWQSGRVHVTPSAMGLAETLTTETIELPVTFEGGLTLLGYRLNRAALKPGQTVEVETAWRVDSPPGRLLSAMAHVLGPDGRVVAVGDGLGVPIESWQAGDVFVQRHTLTLPVNTPPGPYWIQTGVYWLDDGKRWPVRDNRATGDRVLLMALQSP